MAGTTLIAVLRCMGSGVREGWWALGFMAACLAAVWWVFKTGYRIRR